MSFSIAFDNALTPPFPSGICAFQEVFHTEPLQEAIKLSGVYGPQAQLVNYGANGTGPTLALVSNYPVLESCSIPDFPPEAFLHSDAGTLPIKVCVNLRKRGDNANVSYRNSHVLC